MAAPPNIIVTIDKDENVTGNRRRIFGSFTFGSGSDRYATGGLGFDPLQFGLSVLDRLHCEPGQLSDGTKAILASVSPVTPTPLKTNYSSTFVGLVQAYWDAGSKTQLPEVDATTDLTAYTIPFVAEGV